MRLTYSLLSACGAVAVIRIYWKGNEVWATLDYSGQHGTSFTPSCSTRKVDPTVSNLFEIHIF